MQQERFEDFTVATSLERLSALIETNLLQWLPTDRNLNEVRAAASPVIDSPALVDLKATLPQRLPFRSDRYTLALWLPTPGTQPNPHGDNARSAAARWWPIAADYDSLRLPMHSLQRSFGVAAFLTLTPESYSKRVLDAAGEGQTLLSALATALVAANIAWPAFVPVHDTLRDAWAGVAAVGTRSVFLSADGMPALRAAKQPLNLKEASGQLAVLQEQLAAVAPCAAAAVATSRLGLSDRTDRSDSHHALGYSCRRSYSLPALPVDGEDVSDSRLSALSSDKWALGAPWMPWAAHNDPIGVILVDLTWTLLTAHPRGSRGISFSSGSSVSPLDRASKWQMRVLQPRLAAARSLFSLQPADQQQPPLELPSLERYSGAADHQPTSPTSFAGMAHMLLSSLGDVSSAKSMRSLTVPEWWEALGKTVPGTPPDADLLHAMQDIFESVPLPPLFQSEHHTKGGAGTPTRKLRSNFRQQESSARDHNVSGGKVKQCWLPRCAPPGSLLSRLALRALVAGNPRAVAVLWDRFVRELRFGHWEPCISLPRSAGSSRNIGVQVESPDGGACLLQQKVQMVALCIARRATGSQTAAAVRRADTSPGGLQSHSAPSAARSAMDLDGWHGSGSDIDVQSDMDEADAGPASNYSDANSDVGWDDVRSPVKGGLDARPATSLDVPLSECGTTDGDDTGGALQDEQLRRQQARDSAASRDFAKADEAAARSSCRKAVIGSGGCTAGGLKLLLFPDREMNNPLVQEEVVMTEDMQLEQQARLAQSQARCDTPDHQKTPVAAPALLSDMSAFKAANPGALFGDFVRWHSPRDWITHLGSGQLSTRMAQPGNTWQELWVAAPAVAACDQIPLMSADTEGERAIGDLETAPPAATLRCIVALGMASAFAQLASCDAASLPTVKSALDTLHTALAAALEQAQLGAEGFLTRRVSQEQQHARGQQEVHALQHLAAVVPLLGQAEAIVVAGESLTRRLPGMPQLVEQLLRAAVARGRQYEDCHVSSHRNTSPVDSSGGDRGNTRFSAAAPSQASTPSQHHNLLQTENAEDIADSTIHSQPGSCVSDSEVLVREVGDKEKLDIIMQGGNAKAWFAAPGWGQELEAESVITVSDRLDDVPGHRLYVHTTPTGIRIAIVIAPED